MGQIVKSTGTGTTRYVWYPGEKVHWIRAGLAVLVGLLGFGVVGLLSHSLLAGVTVGASATAVLAGLNFGRRDFRELRDFPELARAGRAPAASRGRGADPVAVRRARAARRAAVRHASRAAWRGAVQGVGGAVIALLIANLGAHGVLADWLLPIVPVLLGALAHQAGMVYERQAQVPPPELPPVPAKARAAGTPEDADADAEPPAAPTTRTAGPALRLTSYRGVPPGDPRA